MSLNFLFPVTTSEKQDTQTAGTAKVAEPATKTNDAQRKIPRKAANSGRPATVGQPGPGNKNAPPQKRPQPIVVTKSSQLVTGSRTTSKSTSALTSQNATPAEQRTQPATTNKTAWAASNSQSESSTRDTTAVPGVQPGATTQKLPLLRQRRVSRWRKLRL